MKKYWFGLLAILFVLAGCQNKSDVDVRDAFLGTYEYKATCSVTLSDPEDPTQSNTMTPDDKGTFQIVKKGNKDSVLIIGPVAMVLDSIEAVVKGNQLEIVKSEYKMELGEAPIGISMKIMLKDLTATLTGDSLKWNSNFTCEGKMFASDVVGEGSLQLRAKKIASPDKRDAFVGTYDYTTEGEMTRETKVTIPGFNPSLPLDSEGTFTISKVGDKDSVLVEGAFNGKIPPFKAVVEGNKLRVVQDKFTAKGSSFEVSLTVDNTIIPLEDDTLTWEAENVQCEGTLTIPVVGDVNITGQGHVSMTAVKQ